MHENVGSTIVIVAGLYIAVFAILVYCYEWRRTHRHTTKENR